MKEVNNSPVAILVIDDEPQMLKRIAEVIEGAGYCCQCAQDAASAHAALNRAIPNLIISDINLVGRSGLTVCEQLKQQAGIRDVPVMFLSSAQVPDIIRRSYETGGVYYLRKPFDPRVLLQIIDKVRLASPERVAAPVTAVSVAAPQPVVAAEPQKSLAPRINVPRTGALVAH